MPFQYTVKGGNICGAYSSNNRLAKQKHSDDVLQFELEVFVERLLDDGRVQDALRQKDKRIRRGLALHDVNERLLGGRVSWTSPVDWVVSDAWSTENKIKEWYARWASRKRNSTLEWRPLSAQ